MNKNKKELANEYITRNDKNVNGSFRPAYHFSPPVGWMNDPNGLVWYKGIYHIFYQYNPYDSVWGPMHWGHAVSKDLLSFEHCGIALAPDKDDEDGCFSGGAVVNVKKPDELVLLYTKHKMVNGVSQQRQGKAVSYDGTNFTKTDKPVIDICDIPKNCSITDFRDPRPVYVDGCYYVFLGSKSLNNMGQVLVYRSEDLKNYSYFTVIGPDTIFGDMAECPDFVRLGGKDVLILSSINLKKNNGRFNNPSSCIYLIGKFDIANKKFDIEKIEEFDCGHDFYAPQALTDGRGRIIMLAWMEMWKSDYFLHKNKHGWNGALTVPRVLSYRGGRIIQEPVEELKEKRVRIPDISGGALPRSLDGEFVFGAGGEASVRIGSDTDSGDYIEFGIEDGRVFLDLSNAKAAPKEKRFSKDKYLSGVTVRVLTDISSIELFIDGGADTVTSRMFLSGNKFIIKTCGDEKLLRCAGLYEIVL